MDLFLDSLPVSIYEAGELISEENIRCLNRDMQILSKCPSSEKVAVEKNLQRALHNRITQGTEFQFLEIREDSGIRFNSIAKDIEFAIGTKVHEITETTLGSLSLPQL